MFPLLTCISFYEHEENSSELKVPEEAVENLIEVEADIIAEEPKVISSTEEYFEVDEEDQEGSIENIEELQFSTSSDETLAESTFTENNAIAEEPFSDGIIVDSSFTDQQEQVAHAQSPPEQEQIFDHMAKQFSLRQSNTLYFLFCLSFAMIIGADFTLQRARWSYVSLVFLVANSVTTKYLFIFLLNLYLWVDFIRGSQSESIVSLCNGKRQTFRKL